MKDNKQSVPEENKVYFHLTADPGTPRRFHVLASVARSLEASRQWPQGNGLG